MLSEKRQQLYKLKKVKSEITDIVDLKATFSEKGFWNSVETLIIIVLMSY